MTNQFFGDDEQGRSTIIVNFTTPETVDFVLVWIYIGNCENAIFLLKSVFSTLEHGSDKLSVVMTEAGSN